MKLPVIFVASAASAVLAAVGIMFPNPIVAGTSVSIVLIVVAGSIVAAVCCRNRMGAAWRGFAAFAATYFLFTVLVGDVNAFVNSQLVTAAEPPRTVLLPTYLLAWAYDATGQPEIWTRGGSRVPSLFLLRISPSLTQFPASVGIPNFEAFVRIGQCIFTLWMGLLGGWIGWWMSDGDAAEVSSKP